MKLPNVDRLKAARLGATLALSAVPASTGCQVRRRGKTLTSSTDGRRCAVLRAGTELKAKREAAALQAAAADEGAVRSCWAPECPLRSAEEEE